MNIDTQGLSRLFTAYVQSINKIEALVRFYNVREEVEYIDDDRLAKLYCETLYILKFNGTIIEKED